MKKKDRLLLDFYFKELNDEEKEEFIKHLGSDKEFLRSFIKSIELKESIDNYLNPGEEKSTKHLHHYSYRKPVRIGLSLLAVASILLLLILFIKKGDHLTNGEKLFNEYYSPYDIYLTRGGALQRSPLEILALYIKKDYKQIYLLCDSVQIDASFDIDILYLMFGVSSLEMNDLTKAQQFFESIEPDFNHYSTASWFRVLIQVKLENFDVALELLESTIGENLIYYESAEKLRDDILLIKKKVHHVPR